MIRTLIKLAVMLASYFGWWEFFRGRCRMNVYFAPAFTIAFQFTVMFLPGLLNFLPEAAWVLYLGGLLLLLDALRREKLGFLRHYANWGYLLFFLAFGVMALAFRGKVVTWFDNFTHWAVAVKNMLAADRFPTFAQEAVTFNTYPLGSTAIIWYFSRFTSGEEDFWMLAQGFMLLCMLLPMFAWGKQNDLLTAVFLGLAGNFLLCYNIPLTELLVDTLLPLAGTALLLFLHRECLREEEPLSGYYAVPFLFWVMNIKNAGLLFVFAGMGILLWRMKKQGRDLKPLLAGALVLLAGYFLWDRHCDYVFYQNTFSQHEISLDYFSTHLGYKSWEDCSRILSSLVREMVMRRELVRILAGTAALSLLNWLLAPEEKREIRGLLVFFAVSFLVYGISLAGMYIFTMGREAALDLQSADRYIRIWEICAVCLLVVYTTDLSARVRQKRLASLGLTALMAVSWLDYYSAAWWFWELPGYSSTARMYNEAPIWEYGVQPGYSYLICADDEVQVPAFQWMYHLDSNRVLQIRVTEASQMEAEKDYDYVVILDENNPVIEQWVAETYPDQAGRAVIQCFK